MPHAAKAAYQTVSLHPPFTLGITDKRRQSLAPPPLRQPARTFGFGTRMGRLGSARHHGAACESDDKNQGRRRRLGVGVVSRNGVPGCRGVS